MSRKPAPLTTRKPRAKASRRNSKETRAKASRRITRRPRRTPGPTPKKRRRNPSAEDAAAAMSESFHGRPVQSVRDVTETTTHRAVLADLGRLIELQVWLDEDNPVALQPRGVRLACTPDGGSLYFIGGDQVLNLKALGLDKYAPKDVVTVGQVGVIAYHTSKVFHNFEPSEYEHEFGEEGGELPTLSYDVLNRRLFLSGGSYTVKPEGIVN